MMEYKTIATLGDSIVNGFCDEEGLGWVSRLSQKIAKNIKEKYYFCNMSKGGDTVCDIYHRFAYEVFSRDVDIVIISVGINDIVRTPTPDSPNNLSEAFRKKYWNILLDIAKKTNKQIMVTDILPIIEEARLSGEKYNLNSDVKKYNSIIKDICKQKGIHFFERFDKWNNRDITKLYSDTVHPKAEAHQIICDEIYEELIRIKFI